MLKLKHTQKPWMGILLPHIRHMHRLSIRRRAQSINNIHHPVKRFKSDNTFPKRIVEFIKQETQYITDRFAEEEHMTQSVFNEDIHDTLKPNMKVEVRNCIDDYNRFVKILHYNPVDVHPSIYIHYIETLKVNIDDLVRKLTVERLSHHGLYNYVWKYLIDETSTINDIEEIIDEMGNNLEKDNNLTVGLFRSLISSQQLVPNQSLKGVIVDAACHNFSIPKNDLLKALELLENKHFHSCNISNHWEWLVVNKELLRSKQSLVNAKSRYILPGWFSFLTEETEMTSKETLLSILNTGKGFKINDRDLSNILNVALLPINDLLSLVKNEYLTSPGVNRSITNLADMCMEQDDVSALCELLSGYSGSIRSSTLSKALHYLYKSKSPKLDHILDQVHRNTSQEDRSLFFVEFLNSCVPLHDCSPTIHKIILSTYQTENFRYFLRNKIPISSENKDEVLVIYKDFVHSVPLPTKVLLELMRNISVRNQIYDGTLISLLFREAFEKLNIVDDSFPDLKTKRKFTSTIRSFGQLISDLEDDGIKKVLTCIYNTTMSHDFMKVASQKFKFRIFQSITEQTIRFLERKKSYDDILGVLSNLKIPREALVTLIYYLRVKRDPQTAFDILEEYKSAKTKLTTDMVKFIERGVLTNQSRTEYEKLKMFNEFRTKLLSLGYNVKFNKNNVVLLIKMIVDASKEEDKSKLVKVIKTFGKQQKLPQFVIEKWVERANCS